MGLSPDPMTAGGSHAIPLYFSQNIVHEDSATGSYVPDMYRHSSHLNHLRTWFPSLPASGSLFMLCLLLGAALTMCPPALLPTILKLFKELVKRKPLCRISLVLFCASPAPHPLTCREHTVYPDLNQCASLSFSPCSKVPVLISVRPKVPGLASGTQQHHDNRLVK